MSPSGMYRRRPDVVKREIAGELFLIPLCATPVDMENVFVLNPVGDFIWQRLDGGHSLEQITAAITAEFNVTAEQAAADAREFIEQLEQNQLLEPDA